MLNLRGEIFCRVYQPQFVHLPSSAQPFLLPEESGREIAHLTPAVTQSLPSSLPPTEKLLTSSCQQELPRAIPEHKAKTQGWQ